MVRLAGEMSLKYWLTIEIRKPPLSLLAFGLALVCLLSACAKQTTTTLPAAPATLPPEWTATLQASNTPPSIGTDTPMLFTPTWTPTAMMTLTPDPSRLLPTYSPTPVPPLDLPLASDESGWAIWFSRDGGSIRNNQSIALIDSKGLAAREIHPPGKPSAIQLINLYSSGESAGQWLLASRAGLDVELGAMLAAKEGGVLIQVDLRTTSSPSELISPLLLRLDQEGYILWERYISGDPLQSIEDGGFLLHDSNRIIKLDPKGNVLWEKIPILDGQGVSYKVRFAYETIDGELMVSGEEIDWVPPTPSPARYGTDELGITALWFARFSRTDQILWKRNMDASLRFSRIAYGHRTDGSLVAAGPISFYRGCSSPSHNASSWILSIAPDGSVAFSKRYLELSKLYGFSPTQDGGLLIYGEGPEAMESHTICTTPMLIRLDAQGIVQWSRAYSRGGGITSAVELEDGSILIGWAFNSSIELGGMLIRLDSNGILPNCEVFWSDEQHMPAGAYSPGRDRGARLTAEMDYPSTFLEAQPYLDRATWTLEPIMIEQIAWCRSLW